MVEAGDTLDRVRHPLPREDAGEDLREDHIAKEAFR
jgi:hypothetical protein